MNKGRVIGASLALIGCLFAASPALAQGFYVNPYAYNNYSYRNYAPCGTYGYCRPGHVVRDTAVGAAVGAGIGAVVGLLASHHGHRYY